MLQGIEASVAAGFEQIKLNAVLMRGRNEHEIIPLIDIMFFLLASFMLASLSMMRLQSIKMDLPSASTAHQRRAGVGSSDREKDSGPRSGPE